MIFEMSDHGKSSKHVFFLSSDRETGNLLDEEEFNEVPCSLQFFSEVQIAHSR